MGSQDQHRKYNDPKPAGDVEQYSYEYLKSLRSSDPEELVRLWDLGHFRDAVAEQGETKRNRAYSTERGLPSGGHPGGTKIYHSGDDVES